MYSTSRFSGISASSASAARSATSNCLPSRSSRTRWTSLSIRVDGARVAAGSFKRIAPKRLGCRPRATRSPHPHPICGREIEFLPGLDAKGTVPGIEVANGVGAVLVGRVSVGHDPPAERRLADRLPPALREAEEEELIAAEARGARRRLAAQGKPPAVVCDREAGNVGDVLTERLLAVNVDTGEGLVVVELLGEPRPSRTEVREILRRPPVLQSSARIEERPLIVEAVADLVTDGRADRAVVHYRVAGRREVGRLQDRSRKVEGIHRRQIHRIDQLRVHDPLAAIDRAAELGEVAPVLEELCPLGVAE